LRFHSASDISKNHPAYLRQFSPGQVCLTVMPEKPHFSVRDLPRPLRWLLGLIPAALSITLLLLLPPDQRSPYLLAYPGVVLSAWFFGLGGGVVSALASGIIIE
jgi:glucose-6-phosphate-specific signal transduction histidine kinase